MSEYRTNDSERPTSESVSTSLQQTINGVYQAFKDVPRPISVDACPCCLHEDDICVLLSKPLRELSAEDLSPYAGSVFLTVGAVDDFLYFLPRILEILASNRDWWPDPEVVTRAINTSGFHSWPVSRKQAVSNYFDSVIGDLLRTNNSGFELDSWICALGRMHVDIAPFLRRIADHGPRLVEFYEVNSQPLVDGFLANRFWDDAPVERRLVVDWFQSAETRKAIEEQYELDGFDR